MRLREYLPKTLQLGIPVRVSGLGVIPIISDGVDQLPSIDLLDEALGKGAVRVTETSEGGEVPFLKLENTGELHVLILEGEELVGGKQNRIVNATILVSAGSILTIPVSCMEAGRWNYQKQGFDSGEAIFRARSRAVQKASVSFSLRSQGSYRSDQRAVWDEVSDSITEMAAASPTSDFRASRERVAHRIEEFVLGVRPAEGQIGAIFIAPGKILGCELLGAPVLFERSIEKIVRSFAFEVLDGPDLEDIERDHAGDWWEKVITAELAGYPSPGLGQDIRVEAPDLIGSGLLWNEKFIHFSCFPGDKALRGSHGVDTRRASASERQRRMRER